MRRKFILLIACVLLVATSFAQTSGTCGPNLTWTFEESTGTLTISGTGEMDDFSESIGGPWRSLESIKQVKIEEGVTSIGNFAFYFHTGNSILTSVTIPESVTTIGEWSFNSCSNLTSVSIPNSVINIGDEAFQSCIKLTVIDVASDNPNYSSLDGALFDKEQTTIICCPAGKQGEYNIPSSVTNIGRAFNGCSGLTSIIIPNSITSTSIEHGAFLGCTSLTSVTIPNSVTSIGQDAFGLCIALEQVTVEWQTPLPVSVGPMISDGIFEFAFGGVDVAKVKLLVPAGTADLYRAAPVWQDFMIEESTGITSATMDNSPVLSTQYYDLQGRMVSFPQPGQIYIAKELHQSGKTTVRKMVVSK